ncbi:MAG: sialidase, partial [Phycisphaerales bacterium]|nr:sialidase [Phycisphaerales bacterium]
AAAGRSVVAVWTTYSAADRFGRGPLASAVSADGGRTWAAGPNPADDGASTGHAFVDVAADAGGAFHCGWLDGRGPDDGKGNGPGKGLRYARSTDGGRTWSANQTLVDATCECCWNAVATAPGGRVWVLYRQKAPRDMAVVGSADGGKTWAAPVTVGAFDWKVDVCPHVGGAVVPVPGASASSPSAAPALRAVVWTAKGGDAFGCFAVRSPDAGATWAAPHRLGDFRGNHPDLAADPAGRLAAAWDVLTDKGRVVVASTSADGGATWSAPTSLSDPAAGGTHPRVVPLTAGTGGGGGGFRVLWTQAPTDRPAEWTSAVVR